MKHVGYSGIIIDSDYDGISIYMGDPCSKKITGERYKRFVVDGQLDECVCSLFEQMFERDQIRAEEYIKNNEKFIKTCLALNGNSNCLSCILKTNLWESQMQKRSCDIYNSVIKDETYGRSSTRSCFPRGVKQIWVPDMKYVDTIYLKDVDMRKSLLGIHIICKIKNLSAPKKREFGGYEQTCVVYDDNTNKTIKAVLTDDVADFDKWENVTNVELLGEFNLDYERPLHIFQMNAVEGCSLEDQQVTFSRDQETPGYTKWRNDVIKRDEVCQCCGLNKHLVAHHIFGYKEHPELAVNVDNGVTLCQFCHDKYHSIYGVKNINPHDLVEFIRKYSSGGF